MSRKSTAALLAVGMGVGLFAGAPDALADIGSSLSLDVGCSTTTLNRGAVPTTGYPEHRTVYLSGLLTGLTPNQDYTYVLLGANGPIAELGSEFPASADGKIGYNQVALDLTENVVDSTPKSFELRDQAGTVVGRGTTPVVVRSGADCLNLYQLSVPPAPGGSSGTPAYRVLRQTDGNVVERDARNRALWTSGTAGRGVYANLQSDGNLVIRDIHYLPVWTSGTAGHPGATLTLQTDSNIVIRDAAGRAIWSTGIHR